MKYNFYVVQVGYAVFGCGDTEADAIADANSNIDRDSAVYPLSLDTIAKFTGSTRTAASLGYPGSLENALAMPRKGMTNHGEMTTGSMVLLDAAEAEALGYADIE